MHSNFLNSSPGRNIKDRLYKMFTFIQITAFFNVQLNICESLFKIGDRGSTVVNVLCYKSEGRWFDLSWCHWNILLK